MLAPLPSLVVLLASTLPTLAVPGAPIDLTPAHAESLEVEPEPAETIDVQPDATKSIPVDPPPMNPDLIPAPPEAYAPAEGVQVWGMWVDRIIMVGGALLAVVLLTRWLRHGHPDPLANAPTRPHRLNPEGLLAPMFAYAFSMFLLQMPIFRFLPQDQPELQNTLVGSAGQLAGFAAGCTVASMQFVGGLRGFALGRLTLRHGLKQTAVHTLLALSLCAMALYVTVQVFYPSPQDLPKHQVLDLLNQPETRPMAVVLLWVGAAVLAPLAEETFFRGLLQTWLVTMLGQRWLAIAITATLFGMAHFSQPQVVPALILLGLILGHLYERSGALWPIVVVHSLFNLKTLVQVSLPA
jgi:membrane protease YdiL (CAAX protease family)